MRVFFVLVLALAAGGCDDDTTSTAADLAAGGGDDLAAPADLAGDLGCTVRQFPGFPGVQTSEARFDCPCGCMIDTMDENAVSPLWGASTTSGARFQPLPNVGLAVVLQSAGGLEQGGLASEAGPSFPSQFYLDGDFDLLVDYDLGPTPPPGEAHLVLGVRKPTTLSGTTQYEVEREHGADGSDAYATMLGGVPPVTQPTTATHGTLELKRQHFTLTSYADGQLISTLIASEAGRSVVTLAAALVGCSDVDAGSCSFAPRWHHVRLASGTIVNLPQ